MDVHVVIAKLCVPLENRTRLPGNSPRLPLSTPSHQPPNLLYIHRVRGLRCVCGGGWGGGALSGMKCVRGQGEGVSMECKVMRRS